MLLAWLFLIKKTITNNLIKRCIWITCYVYPKLFVKKFNEFLKHDQDNAHKKLLLIDNNVMK